MKQVKIFLLAAITVMGLSMCSENKKSAVAEDEPVDSCAVMPEFPGGQEALMAFINDNIKYPTQAVEVGLEGRVVCDFIIEKDGSVSNVKVAESADSLLDAEAVRVLTSMSAWTPGQNESGEAVRVKYVIPVTFMLDGTRDQVEQQPEFPGGMEAYLDFMAKNIKYPVECEKNGVEGRVLVDVVIDEEGNVTEPKVKKSVDPLLDAEALRVVKMMPKWTPGMNEGKAVKVLYTVPFTFRLK
ncbi:MAG: energy transducer TonB [Prevotella sp.]|nr:energy transducer TonB [Prevotella sp.]